MKKIKIEEFLKSKSIKAIHVLTEQEAKTLCETFHMLGKQWSNGESFLNNYKFKFFKDKTCYLNIMKFANIEELDNIVCEIFEFEQVELNNYKITLDEFWSSKEVLGIRVTTEKNDKLLRQVFHKCGKRWSGRTGYSRSYLEMSPFNKFNFGTDIIYKNDGRFTRNESIKDDINAKVYDFDQVDISKYVLKESLDLNNF